MEEKEEEEEEEEEEEKEEEEEEGEEEEEEEANAPPWQLLRLRLTCTRATLHLATLWHQDGVMAEACGERRAYLWRLRARHLAVHLRRAWTRWQPLPCIRLRLYLVGASRCERSAGFQSAPVRNRGLASALLCRNMCVCVCVSLCMCIRLLPFARAAGTSEFQG